MVFVFFLLRRSGHCGAVSRGVQPRVRSYKSPAKLGSDSNRFTAFVYDALLKPFFSKSATNRDGFTRTSGGAQTRAEIALSPTTLCIFALRTRNRTSTSTATAGKHPLSITWKITHRRYQGMFANRHPAGVVVTHTLPTMKVCGPDRTRGRCVTLVPGNIGT